MLIPNKLNGFNQGTRQLLISVGGGGGGGGQQPAPSSQRVEQTSIPDYARPYVETMLGQTAALTDINQNPYQPYSGQRVAGFTPMQAQGFQDVAGQQVAGQIGEASNLASQVGKTALGAFEQGQQLGRQSMGYGGTGMQYGTQGAQQAISRADEIAQQARLFGNYGTEYGGKAASLSPQAQQYGQQAADIGMGGLGYGAMGAGLGAQAAGMSGMGFGAGQRFENMATSPGAQQAYMSPYMQNVVDYQKDQAIRDYGIASQGRNYQAAKSGAFGGSRQAVAEGEANRALMNQLGGIQATGTQKAFEDAQNQMRFGSQLGLQGLQAGYQGLQAGMQGADVGMRGLGAAMQGQQAGLQGLGQAGQLYGLGMQGAGVGLQSAAAQQGAGQLALAGTGQGMQGAGLGMQGVQGATAAGQYGLQGLGQSTQASGLLGQLGASQFAQQRDITNDMLRAGAVQQGQQQQGLDVQYQDFLKSQNYPYQQLAFQSDMFRGLPLSQTAGNFYTAPPSTASQLGGLGTTALGIYGMSGGFRAKGGMVGKGYAQGGQVGYAKGGDISMLSTEQLTKLLESPNLTPIEVSMIEEQLMLRRRMESNPEAAGIMAPRQQTGGIGAIPTGNMVPEEMAGGGIVAFSQGGNEGVNLTKNSTPARQSYREQLEKEVLESMKRLRTDDPFKESRAQDETIRSQIARSREVSPYEALTMAGLGAMSGTSQYGLTNVGLGGLEGMKSYGRSKREEADLQKQLLQQGVEREKSQFGRETQLLSAQQTALGQLYGKEADIERAKIAKAQLGQGNATQNMINAQRVFDNAVKAEKTNLFQQNKAKFNMDYTSAELDAEATANVMKRLTPGIKNILFPDGMIAPAAAAPVAAPAGDKKSFPKPSGAAVKQLRDSDNPTTRGQFDAIFGPGAAQKAIGK
jgi:hypothetical protein